MISQLQKGWRNPWVLGLMTAVIAGVLGTLYLIWSAAHNPNRILDEDYNVKKHHQYDAKWLQQQAERSTLAWQAKLHSPQRLANDPEAMESAVKFILIANPAQMQFELKDKEGNPVSGGEVLITAQWPSAAKFDTSVKLQEVGSGQYSGMLNFPRPGNWDLLIKVVQEGRIFEMEQKVFVSVPKST